MKKHLQVLGLLVAALFIGASSCNQTVTTSTGAQVPAGIVIAQDATADVLVELKDLYLAAVEKHDAVAGTEPAEAHAARREKLIRAKAGLGAAGAALEAWKASSVGVPPREVLRPAIDALPDLIEIAVSFELLPRARADALLKFLAPLRSRPPTPKAGGGP